MSSMILHDLARSVHGLVAFLDLYIPCIFLVFLLL